jgi:hypothetical protein
LNRYLSDGGLEIDNGEAERANRAVAAVAAHLRAAFTGDSIPG